MSLTGLAFLSFFAGFAGLALLRNPVYGLYLYVAVFYLDPTGRWWGQSLPDLRWSMTSAAVVMLAVLIHGAGGPRQPIFTKGPALLFLIFTAWMWIQTPWAAGPEGHWFGLTVFSKYLIVIYLIYALVDSRERLAGFLLTHALGCFYLGYVAWTVGAGGRLDGVGGPGIDNANGLAMQFGTGVFAAAGYYFAERGWYRYVPLLVVPFALNGLILAGSRGGFLALIMAGVVFFVMRPKSQLAVAVVYGGLALGLVGYVASDFFWERIRTIGTVVQEENAPDHSVATRMALFGYQWEMAKDHPLGAGHLGTTALSYAYLPEEYHSSSGGRASHNTIMSSLVDQGFPGLVLWLTIMALIWFRLRRHRRWANRHGDLHLGWLIAGIAAMFACVVTAGLFAPLIRTEVYIWVLALTCSLDRITLALESGEPVSTQAPPTNLQPARVAARLRPADPLTTRT